MKLLYIIYTHNRPIILKECLATLFSNTNVKPHRVVILDDASEKSTKVGLWQFCLENSTKEMPIDMLSFNENIGYGTNFEFGLSVARVYNPEYVFFVESDYIFRKNWAEDILEVFESEIGKKSIGISGYDHPDFYTPERYDKMYRNIIKEDYGSDPVNRTNMFKLFDCTLGNKTLKLSGISNSCGTIYLKWRFTMELMKKYPEMKTTWWERLANKQPGGNRKLLADGPLSHGLSYYWSLYAKEQGWDTSKYFPLLNIVPSVSNHINALGINGNIPGIQEGQTFVGSPSFSQ